MTNTLLLRSFLRVPMQSDLRCTSLRVGQNLDVLHGSTGTLGAHVERFEDSFFARPTSSEGRGR